MFGRKAERTRIAELLVRAAGEPVGVAIEGTPGIGKTTVWGEAVEAARTRGYRVLVAAPSEADAALAFSGLGDLFDGVSGELLDRLSDPQRRALGAALFLSEAPAAPEDLDAAVVVAIDDEQWLDRDSARVLSFALRRIREERICLLLSRRAESNGLLWADAQHGFAAGMEVITLAGLDLASTSALLAEALVRKVPRRLAERVHKVSGGNPLYVLALGTELKRRHGNGGGERELPIPRTLTDAIAQRLEHVRAGVEAPLFAIAALATPTLALLGAALSEFTPDDLDDAVSAGVLEITGERIRFTHPLLASVYYASVAPADRAQLHLRLAAVVPDREERALHLALGTESPDGAVAADIERSADLAARRGAPEAAAELLDHAIRVTPADRREERWSRVNRAAEQHLAGGDFAAAREMLEQLLLEQPGGAVSARARLTLAILRKDDFDFAASMLEQALVDAGEDDRLISEIELVYADWCSNLGEYAGMVPHAEAAVASAERLGEPGPLASALAQLGHARCHAGHRIRHDLFERAIELEHRAGETVATFFLPSTVYGAVLRIENDLDAARPLLEAAVARARRRGEEGWTLLPLLLRLALLEWEAGNWPKSERLVAEAAEAARQQVDEEIDSWIAHLEGALAASRGELGRARAAAEEALTSAVRNRDVQMERYAEMLVADVELWGGQPEAAHERLQRWRQWTIAKGPWCVGSSWLPLWSSDIEALIALDRLDEAQVVVDDLLKRALAYPNPHGVAIAKRCEGLLLAARGELPCAIDALDVALAEHARRPLPLELGRTLLEKGSLERRAKRKTAAKHTLERALEVLEPLEASDLGGAGARRARPGRAAARGRRRWLDACAGAGRRTGGRRRHQSRDRTDALHERAHGRVTPDEDLRRARDPLTRPARHRNRHARLGPHTPDRRQDKAATH